MKNGLLLTSVTCESTHLTLKRFQGSNSHFLLVPLTSHSFLSLLTPSSCSSLDNYNFFLYLGSSFVFASSFSLLPLAARSFLLLLAPYSCSSLDTIAIFFFNFFLCLDSSSRFSLLAPSSHLLLQLLTPYTCSSSNTEREKMQNKE